MLKRGDIPQAQYTETKEANLKRNLFIEGKMIKNIIRVMFLIIIAGIIGYIWLSVSSSATCAKKTDSPPPVSISPPYYLVSTQSLVYAGKFIEENQGAIIISLPYTVKFKKGEWTLRQSGPPLILYRSIYGKITVTLIEE